MYKLMGWYRAEIIKYTDNSITVRYVDSNSIIKINNQHTVRYVDFGNVEEVRDSLLVREIPTQFAQLPAIAVRLVLIGQLCHCCPLIGLLSFDWSILYICTDF